MTLPSVGSFEAKTNLAQLLERAMRGEEIVIKRRGKPVAKLGPVGDFAGTEHHEAAVQRLRLLAKKMKLSGSFWETDGKPFKDQGRR